MKEIGLVFFGWLLGLIGPTITDLIKGHFRRKEVVDAIRVELEDLQFRLAISSMVLIQKYGELDKQFLEWIQAIVNRYSGNEPSGSIRQVIPKLLSADQKDLEAAIVFFRGQQGTGSSLKKFQAKFLESHLADVASMPVPLQRKIHEFRNQLDILNQEIAKTDDYMKMTFDESMVEENHRRVKAELMSKYQFVQSGCKLVADKIDKILADL